MDKIFFVGLRWCHKSSCDDVAWRVMTCHDVISRLTQYGRNFALKPFFGTLMPWFRLCLAVFNADTWYSACLWAWNHRKMAESDFRRQVGAAGRMLPLLLLTGRAIIPGLSRMWWFPGRTATDWYCDAAAEERLTAQWDGFENPLVPCRGTHDPQWKRSPWRGRMMGQLIAHSAGFDLGKPLHNYFLL